MNLTWLTDQELVDRHQQAVRIMEHSARLAMLAMTDQLGSIDKDYLVEVLNYAMTQSTVRRYEVAVEQELRLNKGSGV